MGINDNSSLTYLMHDLGLYSTHHRPFESYIMYVEIVKISY